MVVRKVLIFAALCALSALSAASAFGDPVWREGSATGPLVPVGATLTSNLAAGTTWDMSTSFGVIKCSTGSFAERVTSNASGGAAAAATVTAFNFGQPAPAAPCSGTWLGQQFQNITLANAPTLTQPSTTALSQTTTTMTFNLVGGGTCTFSTNGTPFTGAWSNTDNSLSWSSVPISAGYPCGNASMTLKFAPLVLQGTTTKIFTAAS